MAFYRISEDEGNVTFELPRGNAVFHFIFFRIYSLFLVALGVFVFFFLKYESPREPWIPFAGILPVIPGLMMLFSPYVKSLTFTPEEILLVRHYFLTGFVTTRFSKHDMGTLNWRYSIGRYGGVRLFIADKKDKNTILFRIPQLRLNLDQWKADLADALQKTGYEINPPLA